MKEPNLTLSSKPELIRTVVLYDPVDGRIIHAHTTVDFPGALSQEEAEIEENAKNIAKKVGRKIGLIKSLHIKGEAFKPGHRYRVDLQNQCLVAEKIKEKRTT